MSSQLIPALPAAKAAVESSALDRSLLHGLAWTSAAKWTGQLLSWASTLIVARLLTPEDYGLVGMASVYLGLITLLSEFGLGTTVVTLRRLTDDQVAQLNGLAVLVGVCGFAVACAGAPYLGRFFHAPQLPAVVIAMSAAFVITSFKTVPFALLQRELRFRSLALIETGRVLVLAVSMIGFAAFGFGYWTLAIGGVLSSIISTASVLALRRHRIAWPRPDSLRHAMTFSIHILIGGLCWYIYSNADFLVAGRILGKTALGIYEVGWMLANVPVEKITALVTQVTPSVLSAVQADYAALRRYLLRLTEGLALVAVPATLGIALIASDFVPLALGQKWQDAIVPLQLLALSATLRTFTPVLPQVLNAVGQSRAVMGYGILWAVVLPVSFCVFASRWGVVGLALAWVVVHPLLFYPAYRRVLATIQVSNRAYLQALWPAFSASVAMAVSVLAVRWAAGEHWSLATRFAAQVGAGALAYTLTLLLLHRPRLVAFYSALQAARARS